MRSEHPRKMRLERQPHRDAVRKLRKAYGLLWRMSPPTTSTIVTTTEGVEVEEEQHLVQEVQQ